MSSIRRPDFQIAFQGGGARIASLLAVAEAIQNLEQLEHFAVRRLSGTSAGAIVAAAYACGLPFKDLDSKIIGGLIDAFVARRDFRQMSASDGLSKLGVAWRLANGEPLVQIGALRQAVIELLSRKLPKSEIESIKIGKLDRPLLITATDLRTRKAHVFNPEDGLVEAIVNSCAFPFVFRGHKSFAHNCLVDGGLSENLPTSKMASDLSFGQPIAVALDENLDNADEPKNAGAYAVRLFQSAINNSVERAKREVGEHNVFSARSNLSTFDFVGAKKFLRGSVEYESIRKSAGDWFLKRTEFSVKASVDAVDDGNVELMSADMLMRTIGEAYKAIRPPKRVQANYMIVRADSLAANSSNGPTYDQVTRVSFVRPDEGRDIVQYAVGVTQVQSIGIDPFSLRVFRHRGGKNEELEHTKLPMIATVTLATGEAERGRVLITLHDAISASEERDESLCVVYSYYMKNAFPDLEEKGFDYVTITAQEDMEVEEAYIVILVPADPRAIEFTQFDGSVEVTEIGLAELPSEYVKGMVGPAHSRIWRARGIRAKQTVGIKLVRKP